jgi:hypothetical protein
MPEVIDEMHRRGTTYSDTTIRTMISAHLCAEATGDGVAGYTDLSRVGRGAVQPYPAGGRMTAAAVTRPLKAGGVCFVERRRSTKPGVQLDRMTEPSPGGRGGHRGTEDRSRPITAPCG